jgi:Transposase DDE domain.
VQTESHNPTLLAVTFDDDRAVAGAGLALVATLSKRLGTYALANEVIDLGDRPGHTLPGRKVLTLVHAMAAGADCIDDCDVLRSGSTGKVLGHGVMAPSTLGTFLRAFTFGHVRQLDRLSEELLSRAWGFGAGPGEEPMTIDIDSTIQQVYGKQKQGSGYGYTKVLGQHPLVATRAETGEVLHIRHRKGSANSGRGAPRFVRETIGRVRRAGAVGPLTLRADSGFYSKQVVAACRDHDVRYSITVSQNKAVIRAIDAIIEEDWIPIDYTLGGKAEVAECPYGDEHRLVVRRTRLTGKQAELFPSWRYHAFITDREGSAIFLDADHRNHAVVELNIRDLKEGAGMAHCPSGDFNANAAWAVLATVAHNMVRWIASLGLEHHGPVVMKTIRRKFLTVPGRLTRRSRRMQLHLPTAWPWATEWSACFDRLRALPPRT